MTERIIRIATALIRDADGKILLVRKRGTRAFMQPGGKIDPGETPLQALLRELQEEIALHLKPADLVDLGTFAAPAANEPGFTVEAALFAVTRTVSPSVQAEIEEAAWVDPADPGTIVLAPLTRDYVLPLCAALNAEGPMAETDCGDVLTRLQNPL
ncbi:NUDIX hydrolase [Acetobacter oeni]|uniref:DNA mismatch repair protein MutT n=1 Tax=Acetobacter oeni TaxID=304077 RepID=A0A511XHJ1_9PROT|nr:NUDIX domain-containing protein [Acetobacter oeni]MBB3881263.1 mutator protein MutT [Acetobacter oeni]NHO18138.1 NUDIX domain-containing protein [Acetobacter oeni]GBR08170.1 phosphohydrolase [Acetobacter oeni LMG 21952]GEN62418.1 DNA mismatch repair protein MutT [Acetobacter oeni]